MKDIIIAGVGGQGVILASKVIMEAALLSGFDVKGAEVHGMAQRGGSVDCYVRFAPEVHSPLISRSCADIVLAFEQVEALRKIEYLKDDGVLIVNNLMIESSTVANKMEVYPENIIGWITENFSKSKIVESKPALQSAGSNKALNIVMVGVLSKYLDFSNEIWENAIRNSVKPDFIELNLKAFRLGRDL